jgi:anaerobic C4-dicarboxylate transporter
MNLKSTLLAILLILFMGSVAQTSTLDRDRAIQQSLEQQRARDRDAREALRQREQRQRQLSRDLQSDRQRMIERTRPRGTGVRAGPR